MKKLLLLFIFIGSCVTGFSQTANPTATLQLTLTCTGGTGNRSGIAFNPNQQLYYSVNAGSSGYPIETYDVGGNLVSTTTQSFDYRGCWWNPNTNTLEGNGYSSNGIWIQNLNASFYPLNSGINDVPSTSGPDPQSCGDYDYNNDEIIYHNSGTLYIHDRATNTMITSMPITGLPVATSNLNWTGVAYTGIPGMEIGVYDYINQAFYFIDRTTGAYAYTCQLPGTAPVPNYLRMGFENECVWLFNGTTLTWYGYNVMNQCVSTASSLTETVCASYLSPAGNTYTTTGMYYDTIPNAAGCDSIITIDLTVQNTSNSLTETACSSYLSPAGNTYTTSGMYYDTITNAAGCDSIITIDLTIIPNNIDNTVTQNGSQLYANQLVAAYQWIDCDNGNTPIPGAINQFYEVTTSGNYAVEITYGGCTDTSACMFVDLTGITELEAGFNMYPNPVNGTLNLEHDFNSIDICIKSMSGQLVLNKEGAKKTIDVSELVPGAYFVEVTNGKNKWTRLLIKK